MPNLTLVGVGQVILPQPRIGDTIAIKTGVKWYTMIDNSIRTTAKELSITYTWTFWLNYCYSVEALKTFFIKNRGKVFAVSPWYSYLGADAFQGYFANDSLELTEVNGGYDVTLVISRRLSATGDIR